MDKDRDALYTAIGQALDVWAIIEAHLCSIFAVAVTAKSYESAAASFSAIVSFEAQIDMAHAAMSRTFEADQTILNEWKPIRKKLDKLRPARNKLAHGKVVPVVIKGGGIQFRYLPYYHFFTHKERNDFIHMKLADIGIIRTEMLKMVGILSRFGKQIGARQDIKSGKILTA